MNCARSSSLPHLIPADFLERPINVEQCHEVSFTGGELLARSEHLFPSGRRVIQHSVHWQQWHNAQNLLGTGVVRGQQDCLWDGANKVGRCHNQLNLCYVCAPCGSAGCRRSLSGLRSIINFTLAYRGSRGKLAIFFPRAVRETWPSFLSTAPSSSKCSTAERTASRVNSASHNNISTCLNVHSES